MRQSQSNYGAGTHERWYSYSGFTKLEMLIKTTEFVERHHDSGTGSSRDYF